MAKRERPGQVRVHRGFLKAEGVEVLWPEGVNLANRSRAQSLSKTEPILGEKRRS